MLVPQVDDDGNERDGVRLPEIAAPLGTYAAWNLRDPSIGAPGQRVSFEASYIPFAKTAERASQAARSAASPSRSGTAAARIISIASAHALDDLIEQRWVLPEDRAALMQRGRQEWEDAMR